MGSGWAGYEGVPKLCRVCGRRVTLKQNLQLHTEISDGRAVEKWIKHIGGDDCGFGGGRLGGGSAQVGSGAGLGVA
jgi:hypothetical protein